MVKKWIAMIVIATIIVALCVFENVYIQNSFEYLQNELTVVESMFNEDKSNIDREENISYLTALHERWREKTKILKMVVWHTGMKEVEINMSRIQSYAEQNNYEEAVVELGALQDFCLHYKDDFTIAPENIL